MDEVSDSLIEILTEKIVDLLGNSEQTEGIVSKAADVLQQSIDNLSTSADSLSDDAKETIVDNVIKTLGIAADALGLNDVVETAASVNASSFESPIWKGEFTDACWNVCLISSGEGSLRMKCGYYG